MLFLTFSNFFLFGIQWFCETFRYQRYRRIMHYLLQSAKSVLVQRTKTGHLGDLTKTSLLSITQCALEKLEVEDDYIRISSVDPMQIVDLTSWTSYTSYLDTHLAAVASDQNICVMMEARRPKNLEKFADKTMRVPVSCRVHVLSHGCPIAWKSAEPFGIILHCNLAGLVILSDAFGQGRLTLDEDLELIGLVTVRTKGIPQPLVPPDEDLLKLRSSSDEDRKDQKDAKGQTDRGGRGDSAPAVSGGGSKMKVVEGKQTSNALSLNESSAVASLTQSKDVQRSESYKSSVAESNLNSQTLNQTDKKLQGKGQTNSYVDDIAANSRQQNTQNDSRGMSPSENVNYLASDKNNISSQGSTKSTQQRFTKPPNILVYCGMKDTARKFSEVKSSLEACINTDAYTIYHLNHDTVVSAPWKSNTALLVISSCTQLRIEVEDEFAKYIMKENGCILSFSSSIDSLFTERLEDEGLRQEGLVTFKTKDSNTVTSVRGRFCYKVTQANSEVVIPWDFGEKIENEEDQKYASVQHKKAMVLKVHCEGGGIAVLSQLLLERDPTEYATDQQSFNALKRSNTDRLSVLRSLLTSIGIDTSPGIVPPLTPCLVLAQKKELKDSFLNSFKHRLVDKMLKSQNMSLKFVPSTDHTQPSVSVLPVVTDYDNHAKTEFFDVKTYWENLKTSRLGQVLFYTDVITTTMTVFDGLLFSIPDNVGPIAVAGRQTSGKGRSGNAWLSPVGCAMFTLPLSLSTDSELGQHVSFLQHIVSLAVVQSVVTLPGYEDLDIKLKWPNDIYYGKEMKLGGVLVTSTVMGSTIYATIGCGFNVSNSNPTICINDIIHLYNTSHPDLPDLSPVTPSQLIARTVSILESLIEEFKRNGHKAICDLYYKHWLHGGVKVNVEVDKTTSGEIVGLDEYGFLTIQTPDGMISVQPDGNSFDMMHNLIHIKPRA